MCVCVCVCVCVEIWRIGGRKRERERETPNLLLLFLLRRENKLPWQLTFPLHSSDTSVVCWYGTAETGEGEGE